jgi:hypothetical protein
MKFNDLSKEQQKVLTAWMNGETIQYNAIGEWINIETLADLSIVSDYKWSLRVKPKEPLVTYDYSYVIVEGNVSSIDYKSITQINNCVKSQHIHSYLKKTYHDGVFVKAEIIPKDELENE